MVSSEVCVAKSGKWKRRESSKVGFAPQVDLQYLLSKFRQPVIGVRQRAPSLVHVEVVHASSRTCHFSARFASSQS